MDKTVLYQYCVQWAQEKIDSIQSAITSAQDAANTETKSTAGDKHDTARAMMQLDVEQKSKQLAAAQKNKMALAQFTPESGSKKISLGSLVSTTSGIYYISISVGKIEIDQQVVFAVSPVSPIAKAMQGLKTQDEFNFNGRQFTINGVE